MRILLHSPYYRPELISIAKYNADLCEWLASRGHQVRVVTTVPHYPQWKTAAGYHAWAYGREAIDGVDVWRCPAWIPARPRAVARVLYSLSLMVSAMPVLAWHVLSWRPDVMIAVEPPLLSYAPVWIASKLGNVRTWLHVQDLEVDAAFDLGLVKGDAARRMALRVELRMLLGADKVSTLSERMRERIVAKGVAPESVAIVPNWADDARPNTRPGAFRALLDIPLHHRIALYAGNMASKQGLEVILQAARQIGRDDLWFVLVGEGPARAQLQIDAQGLDRVRFLPLQPTDMLADMLQSASMHLLPQRSAAADLVMPSKLLGMMASGRPVIAGAQPGTEIARVLDGRGIVIEPENAQQLVDAISRLCEEPATADELGRRAEVHVRLEMGKAAILERFETQLRDLCHSPAASRSLAR